MSPTRRHRKSSSSPPGVPSLHPARGKKTKIATTPPAAPAQAPVVGIGASAGGLEALKSFFGAMSPASGVVFVVVVHLDPTHDSLMPELLAKCTPLTVRQARDRQPLEGNHVYVIPPNRTLTLEKGLIRVREVADRRGLRGTIDQFFRSLADDLHERAICVVLSGTGTEGTLGLRAVKAEGGMVMVQAPDSASQPGMPVSAIATGLVDYVLAPDKMPEALLTYVRSARLDRAAPVPRQKTPDDLGRVLAVLRARTKFDFQGYKRGTLQRRIDRRMGLHQIHRVDAYVDFLRAHPEEAEQLFKDLLIGVTSFFRDPLAFHELATKVVAKLVREKDPDSPFRIWVPGCATGEEAYSIAIVVAEEIAAAQSSCRVQIFATDVDEDTVEIARGGRYPDSVALDITPERLQRFFTHEDHHYTIAKSIRESVIFAVQNAMTDPPFSKLDLVSCRNVFIYLEPQVQEKLLGVFHFSLNPGGYLFLGNAESVGALENLFAPVSKPARIFRRLGPGRHPPVEFPAPLLAPAGAERADTKTAAEPNVAVLADRTLLEQFAPAAVVVTRAGHILRFYGAMGRYISLPTGDATLDVLTLARDALKPTLRAAFHEAVRRNHQTVLETLDLKRDKGRATLRLTVKPLAVPGTAAGLWLIIFEELPFTPRVAGRDGRGKQPDLVRRLDAELRTTKKEQQRLIEQLESGNEELKAANEEILSMNEELQSTNEELVTSKEELQSMNEELTTLNVQLQDKVQELTAVNDDMANLLASTDIATVFIDTEFRIKRFTTAATQLLNLLPSDVGRPINHMATNLVDIDLARDARAVLSSLTRIEKEVAAQSGNHYIVRMVPYRTQDDEIHGVVLTLVDVTALKNTERDLRAARDQASVDLQRMQRVHEVSTAVAGSDDSPALMQQILEAAIEVTGADMGNIQLFREPAVLTIAAQHGFVQPFLDFFKDVQTETDSACARALATRHRVTVENVRTSAIFAGSGSLAVLLAAGVQAVQSTPLLARSGRFLGMLSTHFRAPHVFEEAELRWLDLLARQAADLIVRRLAEESVAKAQRELEQRVADRTKWLTLMHAVTRAINEAPTWDEALHLVLRQICQSEKWQMGYVYLPHKEAPDEIAATISCFEDERLRPFHSVSMSAQYARGQSLPGRVYAQGVPVWVNAQEELVKVAPIRGEVARQVGLTAAVALPVAIGQEVMAVLELFSYHPHEPSEEIGSLMNDVSTQIGMVLERERMTAQMADLVWREQQELLHTLHDSLGQTLTGLGMLSTALGQRLARPTPQRSNRRNRSRTRPRTPCNRSGGWQRACSRSRSRAKD
jgi:chemotaxis methyl-accepting protein methylase/GAF domain-containing protein